MENTIAAIELGSKKIKLVIGYELDGKVYSVYATTKPLGQLIQNNNFFDFQKLIDSVNSIKEFNDPNGSLSYKISECVLCLPADGLEIYQTKQRTPVISEHGKISPLDIKNLYSLIKNSSSDASNVLVDIVPEEYTLDDNRVVIGNPVNDIARTLVLNAKVHLSPEHIYKNYTGLMQRANISIKRTVVSSLASVEYLSTCADVPQNYLLVDIGAGTTSVSLVGKNSLYGTKSFAWGGDNITQAIADKFNVTFKEAENYKKIYGIDERDMHFRAPVCSEDRGEDGTIHYYKEDLNEIITHGLNEFITLLTNSINLLLEKQNPDLRKLPIILVGGGSQLKGLVKYMSDKVESNLIKVITPNTIGARDSTYLNCLGMILVTGKYASLNDDSKLRSSGMTRD